MCNALGTHMKSLSLVLEISGFVLTLTEVIFPKVADKIEHLLDRISAYVGLFIQFRFERLREEKVINRMPYYKAGKVVGEKDGLILVVGGEPEFTHSTRPKSLVFMATCVFTCSMGLIAIALLLELPLIVVILSPLIIFPFLIFLYTPELLDIINKYTKDRALGAIGLTLAISGLLLELYDFFHAS